MLILMFLLGFNFSLSSSFETRFLSSGGIRAIGESDFILSSKNFTIGGTLVHYEPETTGIFIRRNGLLKKYVEARTDNITITAGTFYKVLGRGLVLYAARDEILKMDRFIDGLDMEYRGRRIKTALIFGTPHRFMEYKEEKDSLSFLTGGNIELSTSDGISLGGSYILLRHREFNDKTHYASLRAEWNPEPLSFYFEYALRNGYSDELKEKRNGAADYISIGFNGEKFGINFEFRDFWLFGRDIGMPPALNSKGFYINEAMDERALALIINLAPSSQLTTTIQGSRLYSTGYYGDKAELREVTLNNELTFENVYGELSISYMDFDGARIALGLDRRREIEPEASVTFPIGPFDLEASIRERMRNDDGVRYRDRDIDVSVGRYPYLTLTIGIQRRSGDIEDSWQRIELRTQFMGSLNLSIIAGSTRGDFICSGGICRYEPEFKGLMLKGSIVF